MIEKMNCKKCKHEKSITCFNESKKWCDDCVNVHDRHRATNHLNTWYNNKKSYCKANNIPFNLEKDDFDIPETCEIFGIELDGSDKDHEPTIDRIIPELGYIKGNTKVISFRANRLKNNASIAELLAIVRYIRRHI